MSRGDQRDPLIALRIPPVLDARLRAHAATTGSSLSEIVRDAIATALDPEPSPLSRTARAAGRIEPANETGKRARSRPAAEMCEHRVHTGNYCRHCNAVV